MAAILVSASTAHAVPVQCSRSHVHQHVTCPLSLSALRGLLAWRKPSLPWVLGVIMQEASFPGEHLLLCASSAAYKC